MHMHILASTHNAWTKKKKWAEFHIEIMVIIIIANNRNEM